MKSKIFSGWYFIIVSFALVFIFSGCKKDDDKPEPPLYVDFTYTGNTGTPPLTVTFTSIGEVVDQMTWDFGDGSTGTGMTVQHTYSSVNCMNVKAVATKGSRTGEASKQVAVSYLRKAMITGVTIEQVPPLAPGGFDWDPNDGPDLTFSITFPGDTVYESNGTVGNSFSGYIAVNPARSTTQLSSPIRIDVYDRDAGNVPDKVLMGSLDFTLCSHIPLVLPPPVQPVTVSSPPLRVKFDITWTN